MPRHGVVQATSKRNTDTHINVETVRYGGSATCNWLHQCALGVLYHLLPMYTLALKATYVRKYTGTQMSVCNYVCTATPTGSREGQLQ